MTPLSLWFDDIGYGVKKQESYVTLFTQFSNRFKFKNLFQLDITKQIFIGLLCLRQQSRAFFNPNMLNLSV